MQQCIQAFVQVLDSRCADAKGPAIVNIFSLLDKLTFVRRLFIIGTNHESADR